MIYCFMKFSDLKFCCLSPPIRSIVQIIVKLAPFCTVHSRCCFPYLDRFLIVDDWKKKYKESRHCLYLPQWQNKGQTFLNTRPKYSRQQGNKPRRSLLNNKGTFCFRPNSFQIKECNWVWSMYCHIGGWAWMYATLLPIMQHKEPSEDQL